MARLPAFRRQRQSPDDSHPPQTTSNVPTGQPILVDIPITVNMTTTTELLPSSTPSIQPTVSPSSNNTGKNTGTAYKGFSISDIVILSITGAFLAVLVLGAGVRQCLIALGLHHPTPFTPRHRPRTGYRAPKPRVKKTKVKKVAPKVAAVAPVPVVVKSGPMEPAMPPGAELQGDHKGAVTFHEVMGREIAGLVAAPAAVHGNDGDACPTAGAPQNGVRAVNVDNITAGSPEIIYETHAEPPSQSPKPELHQQRRQQEQQNHHQQQQHCDPLEWQWRNSPLPVPPPCVRSSVAEQGRVVAPVTPLPTVPVTAPPPQDIQARRSTAMERATPSEVRQLALQLLEEQQRVLDEKRAQLLAALERGGGSR